jgi:hypothetical protein
MRSGLGPVITDLISGQILVGVVAVTGQSLGFHRAGKILRPLFAPRRDSAASCREGPYRAVECDHMLAGGEHNPPERHHPFLADRLDLIEADFFSPRSDPQTFAITDARSETCRTESSERPMRADRRCKIWNDRKQFGSRPFLRQGAQRCARCLWFWTPQTSGS